jgi:hypothetical protein
MHDTPKVKTARSFVYYHETCFNATVYTQTIFSYKSSYNLFAYMVSSGFPYLQNVMKLK